ncbi:MAG: DUF3795 domain-containing protein [bacterium]|nr:DUF3795 domain-containing protein [bacterium]
MLGYCGIDCGECRARKATVRGDIELLKQVAARFSGGGEPEEWVCLGCGSSDPRFLAAYCYTCKVRVCAEGKGVLNCAACDGFETCSNLHDFIGKESPELPAKMRLLRKAYLSKAERLGA